MATTGPESRGSKSRLGRESVPSRRCPVCGGQFPLDFLVCPKDATALSRPEADEDWLIGEVLASTYCITDELGAGGMARVYAAEHVRLPRSFAIKVMHEELLKHPAALVRFEREAHALAKVSCEHVIAVVDLLRLKDGRPCLVSELLEGRELGELLAEQGTLPIGTAVAIARQICRGLAAAHAVGVIHRDLKPENLFLVKRSDGRPFVKILDFGVAKLEDGANLTRTGVIVGTPAYMAPEQALGSSTIDERVDVYATGAVLFRMLSGSPPFDGDDPAFILTRLVTEDPPRLRDLNRAIPAGLEHLVQRAMSRAPEERPGSAMELEQELAAFGESLREEGLEASRGALPRGSGVSIQPVRTTAATIMTAGQWGPGRSAAPRLALVASVAFGGVCLATAGAALGAFSSPGEPTDGHALVLGGATAAGMVLVLAAAFGAIVSRWRSAASIEQLGRGFWTAVGWIVATCGATTLGWRAYVLAGPPLEPDEVPFVRLVVFAVPTLLGAIMLAVALRRSRR